VPEILHRSNFVPSYDFGEGVYTFGPYGIVAIGAAIYYLIKLSGSSKNQNVSNSAELYLFSSLMVIICLSAPKGGLLPAISGVVEIPIKSWERLETPLSLIAIMILGLMLTNVEFAQKRARKMRSRFQFLHVLVATTLGIGFLSAQPLGVFNNENAAVDRWDRERSFFQDIEQTYGNIRILQLPKMTFPEGPPVLGVPPYSDFIAHFHSDSLRLSAGEVVEATNFNFEFDLSGSLKALVEKARLLSYEGLLFDRRAISEEFYFELENHGGKLCSAFEKNWKTNFIFCKIN
jgi:hypothetical protein